MRAQSPHSLILQGPELAEEKEKEPEEAEEMELLLKMAKKVLPWEQVVYRLEFGDYRSL